MNRLHKSNQYNCMCVSKFMYIHARVMKNNVGKKLMCEFRTKPNLNMKEGKITCVTVAPNWTLISRDSFLLNASLIVKTSCIYLTALGFIKSRGLFPAKSTSNVSSDRKQPNLQEFWLLSRDEHINGTTESYTYGVS